MFLNDGKGRIYEGKERIGDGNKLERKELRKKKIRVVIIKKRKIKIKRLLKRRKEIDKKNGIGVDIEKKNMEDRDMIEERLVIEENIRKNGKKGKIILVKIEIGIGNMKKKIENILKKMELRMKLGEKERKMERISIEKGKIMNGKIVKKRKMGGLLIRKGKNIMKGENLIMCEKEVRIRNFGGKGNNGNGKGNENEGIGIKLKKSE